LRIGFKVQPLGCKLQGTWFIVYVVRLRVQGLWLKVYRRIGYRVQGLGPRAKSAGLRVKG
jgi:hypothetical protein